MAGPWLDCTKHRTDHAGTLPDQKLTQRRASVPTHSFLSRALEIHKALSSAAETREHVEQNHPRCVDIGPWPLTLVQLALTLLDRRVVLGIRRSESQSTQPLVAEGHRRAEVDEDQIRKLPYTIWVLAEGVDQFRIGLSVEEDVARFDITVKQAGVVQTPENTQ